MWRYVSACDCIRFSTGAYKNVPERIDKHPSTDTFGELGCSLTRFSTGAALQPVREYRILSSSGSSSSSSTASRTVLHSCYSPRDSQCAPRKVVAV